MPTVSVNQLTQISISTFLKVGVSIEESRTVTDLLIKANLAGHDSHGVILIPPYIKGIQKNYICPHATIQMINETESTATIDGNRGFGQVVLTRASEIALEKSEKIPITLISVRNYSHCGQLGSYAKIVSEHNRIGILFLGKRGDEGYIVPWGGRKGRFYINTLAISVPSNQPFPIVLDMATSVAPYGKVELKHVRKEPCPEGWLVDVDGNPSTNPQDLFHGGGLLPLGGSTAGHKGSGLAFMVGVLASTLSQASYNKEGTLFIVINPNFFMSLDDFKTEVDQFVNYIHETPPTNGFEKVLVPGERSYHETQKRLKEGIYIEEDTWKKIVALASESD